MSCGKPHETPCAEVLDHLYEYLDHELPEQGGYSTIRQHLDECGPCLHEYGIEEAVKSLVRRSCSELAPDALRAKVMLKIAEVRLEEVRGDDGVAREIHIQEIRVESSPAD